MKERVLDTTEDNELGNTQAGRGKHEGEDYGYGGSVLNKGEPDGDERGSPGNAR